MTTNICDNPKCKLHLQFNDKGSHYVVMIDDGRRVRVERHLYRSADGKREFFLCDVCHAAVEMVK